MLKLSVITVSNTISIIVLYLQIYKEPLTGQSNQRHFQCEEAHEKREVLKERAEVAMQAETAIKYGDKIRIVLVFCLEVVCNLFVYFITLHDLQYISCTNMISFSGIPELCIAFHIPSCLNVCLSEVCGVALVLAPCITIAHG